MVSYSDVSEGDVLEALFYSERMDADIRVAIDVESVFEKSDGAKIQGVVLEVKNMPFDALKGETIRLDIDADEVYRGKYVNAWNEDPLGTNIKLVSV